MDKASKQGSAQPEAGLAPLRKSDIFRMRDRFDELLACESRTLQDLGRRLFKRIAVDSWSVEWNLPRWLGHACGLTELDQQRLVAINVYGLGYIRIADDRRDGEIPAGEVESCSSLELLLQAAAQRELKELLGGNAWFWEQYQAIMAMWGGEMRSQLPMNVLEMSPSQLDRLADVGAPLLICCAAGAALQDRTPDFESLSVPVCHYLTAAVLFDHMKDWKADLEAGRTNLFVHAMLEGLTDFSDPYVLKLGVYQAFIDGGNPRAYIDLVMNELTLGVEAASVVGLDHFASHLRALTYQARESKEAMSNQVQRYLERGMELLLPA